MTTKFDTYINRVLVEFNVEDRNDPAFYDYVVLLLQQILQRNLLSTQKLGDLRRNAMQIVRDGYFNFIDEENNISFKIAFIFDSKEKDVNNLTVKIYNLINTDEPPKTIENTHEETSITEIVDYIENAKVGGQQQQNAQPGIDVPAEVSQTPPSELPNAAPPQTGTGAYMQNT
jgi:hypothetical protein